MNEEIKALQDGIVEITRLMKEKADKEQNTEVKELSEKLAQVQKELADRRHQFDIGTKLDVNKKELETKMDELFLASALCVRKDGQFDRDAYAAIAKRADYADAIKAFGDVSAENTVTAAEGGAFVPTGFSSTLMEEIFLSLEVAKLFGRINMPNSIYKIPFSPGRTIAHAPSTGQLGTYGEAGTVTKLKPSTAQLTFTAKKIMSIIEMTDEFEQDSIVPALPFLRKQLIDGFALAQETMCINGDTGTNVNVVAITGEDCRKYVNGLRADAIATSATVDLAAATALTADNCRAMRTKMGKYGKKPSDLAYIVNMATYNAMLGFSNYQTLYQYGASAVIQAGEMGRIDNIPVIVSELVPMGTTAGGSATDAADLPGGLTAAGKFDSGAGVKTFGTMILANKNAYMWGDRKEFSLELWRNPLNQTTNLIGAQRLDFEKVLTAADKTSSVIINASTIM